MPGIRCHWAEGGSWRTDILRRLPGGLSPTRGREAPCTPGA